MKFFTEDWATGELSDEEFDAVPTRYAEYISALELPTDVLALDRTDLHDGLIENVSTSGDSAVVKLVTGDQQQGYFTTEISYVVRDLFVAESLSKFVDADIELLHTEVDRIDSAFVHRLLFSTYEHVEIPFESVVVRQLPRKSGTE